MKHLNPRQGITTVEAAVLIDIRGVVFGVKHLNPRQGITTLIRRRALQRALDPIQCETPKSPPGDYNHRVGDPVRAMPDFDMCETPKSPPGDYNAR